MEGIKAVFEKTDCYIVALREVDSGLLKPFDSVVVIMTDNTKYGYRFEVASKAAMASKMRGAQKIKIPEEMEKRVNNILKIWQQN